MKNIFFATVILISLNACSSMGTCSSCAEHKKSCDHGDSCICDECKNNTEACSCEKSAEKKSCH